MTISKYMVDGTTPQQTSIKNNAAATSIDQSYDFGSMDTPPVDSLVLWMGSGRDVGNNQMLTIPSAYTVDPSVTPTLIGYTAPMEFHTAGLAYYNPTGLDGISIATKWGINFSQAADNRNHGLITFVSTNGKLELDKSSFNGTGSTNNDEIQPGSTGTLSPADGDEWLAVVVGQSRTANDGLSIDGIGWIQEPIIENNIDAGSQNTTMWWKVVTEDTALNPTITEANGPSRMGAGIAVFRVVGGGAPALPPYYFNNAQVQAIYLGSQQVIVPLA